MLGFVVGGDEPVAPAGEHDYRHLRIELAYARRHFAAVDIGHAEIGDHDVERPAGFERTRELIDAGLATFGGRDIVVLQLE